MDYSYQLIDAFTLYPFQGAPIAVFADADGLNDDQMQKIARELSQAETVFVFQGDTDHAYELKIYTPEAEIEFGGHPVIAASYVLFKGNMIGIGTYKLKMSVGTLDVEVKDNEKIQFSINATARLDDFVPAVKELGEILHLEESDFDFSRKRPVISSCAGEYLIIPVKSTAQLNKACFNDDKWTMSFVATLARQILLFCDNRDDVKVDYNARLFGKGISHAEDPPIGSSMPAFAHYIFSAESDGQFSAVVQRGCEETRMSLIEVEVCKKQAKLSAIKVGGNAVLVAEGRIHLC